MVWPYALLLCDDAVTVAISNRFQHTLLVASLFPIGSSCWAMAICDLRIDWCYCQFCRRRVRTGNWSNFQYNQRMCCRTNVHCTFSGTRDLWIWFRSGYFSGNERPDEALIYSRWSCVACFNSLWTWPPKACLQRSLLSFWWPKSSPKIFKNRRIFLSERNWFPSCSTHCIQSNFLSQLEKKIL